MSVTIDWTDTHWKDVANFSETTPPPTGTDVWSPTVTSTWSGVSLATPAGQSARPITIYPAWPLTVTDSVPDLTFDVTIETSGDIGLTSGNLLLCKFTNGEMSIWGYVPIPNDPTIQGPITLTLRGASGDGTIAAGDYYLVIDASKFASASGDGSDFEAGLITVSGYGVEPPVVPMEPGILSLTKKALNIPPDYDAFDMEIIMYINSVFSDLNQLGLGPDEGFEITDDSATWSSYLNSTLLLNSVKSYMALRVRLLFDSPSVGFVLTSLKEQIEKLEWRLTVAAEELKAASTTAAS